MERIKAFKIWYSDSTVRSPDVEGGDIFTKWQNCPDEDIQAIVFYFHQKDKQGRPYRRVMQGDDYYGMTRAGKLTQSFTDPEPVEGHIKFGKWTTYENIERIMQKANKDYGEGWLWEPRDIVGAKGKFH